MRTKKTEHKHKYNKRKFQIMYVLFLAKGRGKGLSCKEISEKIKCKPLTVSLSMSHYMALYPPWRNYFERRKHKGTNAYYYTLTKYGLYIFHRLYKLWRGGRPLQLYNSHFPQKHKGSQSTRIESELP